MKLTYKINNVEWIDIINPTSAEIRELVEQYRIDPVVAEELLIPIERPKVQVFPHYLYTVLHFPELSDTPFAAAAKDQYEVDFIILDDTLITIHEKSFPLIYEFTKTIELPSFTKHLPHNLHAGHIFILLMRHFYTHIAAQLDEMARTLRVIEDKIFDSNEELMVSTLSEANRKLLDLKRAIRFHGNTMNRFTDQSVQLFGSDFTPFCEQIQFEYEELAKVLNSHKEVVEDLWRTNDSLVNTRVNDTMRKLTALSFVTFPLSVIVGFFGMNMTLPLIGGMQDFVIVILGMVAAAALLIGYLQHKRWL